MPVSSFNRTITQIAVNQAAAGALDLVAAQAGLKIYVVTIVLVNSHTANGTIKFTEGTGPTDLSGEIAMAVGGGFVIAGNGYDPVLSTNTTGAKLSLVTVTGFVDGYLRYFIDT